jgi:hypothetical protein
LVSESCAGVTAEPLVVVAAVAVVDAAVVDAAVVGTAVVAVVDADADADADAYCAAPYTFVLALSRR